MNKDSQVFRKTRYKLNKFMFLSLLDEKGYKVSDISKTIRRSNQYIYNLYGKAPEFYCTSTYARQIVNAFAFLGITINVSDIFYVIEKGDAKCK